MQCRLILFLTGSKDQESYLTKPTRLKRKVYLGARIFLTSFPTNSSRETSSTYWHKKMELQSQNNLQRSFLRLPKTLSARRSTGIIGCVSRVLCIFQVFLKIPRLILLCSST